MIERSRLLIWFVVLASAIFVFSVPELIAQQQSFHNAPASAVHTKNPVEGQQAAAQAGQQLFVRNCASCHGRNAKGTGNVPSLANGPTQSATPGEIFWFITKGDVNNGMPAWGRLPERQRWQIVSYVQSLGTGAKSPSGGDRATGAAAEPVASTIKAPLPKAPFVDFRLEKPGTMHKITVNDLPQPYATQSASNGATVVERPKDAWPKAPSGFKVELFASGLDNPRQLTTAPNGDIFLAESEPGDIKVFRGMTPDGKAQQVETFATGLNRPFGIAFYPPGPDPQWVYIGDTDAVLRFPYKSGDLKASGPPQHLADLPDGSGHWTRNLALSKDRQHLFVSVGSRSNVDDPDTHPAEKDRADVLEFNPDGSGMRVYAYGIRNCVGLAVNPTTGELWCSTNERDGLGDNLVPDYITHVQEGGFYGWPWWYMGGHQDPRLQGKHPELKDKVITPDVLMQPHNASLGITFYEGTQFPAEYRGDLFAAEHGSWNKSVRVGYEVVRVPLHQEGHANDEYEDFITGFVLPNGDVWGRPVGITVAQDGSLLVSDDGSNSIWRVTYTGK